MRLMLTFFRAYPGQTVIMLIALLLAGIAEGMGLSALLPLLNIAVKSSGQARTSLRTSSNASLLRPCTTSASPRASGSC